MRQQALTADDLERMFFAALKDRDAWGVVSALTVMAPLDPHRAERLLARTTAALDLVGVLKDGSYLIPATEVGRLIIVSGLPGSGKTTRATAYVAESPLTRCRYNRDDQRVAMFGQAIAGRGRAGRRRHEDAVTAVQHAGIRELLLQGWEVLVDDTNLDPGYVAALARVADSVGAEHEVWDMSYVPVDVCIARDANRGEEGGRHVGADAITEMHADMVRTRTAWLLGEAAAVQARMVDRYKEMHAQGRQQWPAEDPITLTVDHATDVLNDDALRSHVEELATAGRRAAIRIVLLDSLPDLPAAADLGGSQILATALRTSPFVTYQRVTT